MGEPTTGQAEVKSSREGGEAELISRSHTGATNLLGIRILPGFVFQPALSRPFLVCADFLF